MTLIKILFTVLVISMAASCAENDSPLVGTWRFDSIAMDGEQMECPVSVEIMPGFSVNCVSGQTLSFRPDGRYNGSVSLPTSSIGLFHFDSQGSWSVLDETLTMENSDVGGIVVDFVIDNDVMIWTLVDFFDEIDADVVLRLTRQ